MKKIIPILLALLFLAGCGSDGKIIMPFEADLEKYFTALSEGEEEEATAGILLENESYSVSINEDDALLFTDKVSGKTYDSFGDENGNGLNISVKFGEETVLSYKKGDWYDITADRRRGTLTVFRLSGNSVRLCYILGLSEFEYLDGNGCSGENALKMRTELLDGGYNPEEVKIVLVCIDISISESGITVDKSKNRQYRSSALKTGGYKISYFEFELPFVTFTESESEPIFSAGSK